MKNLLYFFLLGIFVYSCSSTRDRNGVLYGEEGPGAYDTSQTAANDTVRIANDSLEYEITIIDPGFSIFLNTMAKPEGYYSQSYLENKNRILVSEYNQRVRQPQRYDSSIYEQEIDYRPRIDYGYDVNYKLYNYFVYLSQKYNQRFSVPTRL